MKKLFLLLCTTCTMSAFAADLITIAEFINHADVSTTYRLRGVAKNVQQSKYGNFDLVDKTGSVYIFGLKNSSGETQQFLTMDIAENDTVTLEGVYYLYTNPNTNATKVEIKDAQYISHAKYKWTPVPSTIADFISKNDGNVYFITGKVTEIQNDYYGNFKLQDETGSLLVWGLVDGSGAKIFSSSDIQVGDTVTVKGSYTLYEDPKTHEKKNEMQNALFVSHVVVLPNDGIYFPASFRKGWDMYMGQTLTFKEPFYVVAVPSSWDSIVIATERLQSPEEVAAKLHLRDSADYKKIAAHNEAYKIGLKGTGYIKSTDFRCGAVISPLRAKVVGERSLVLEEQLPLLDYTPVTTPPSMSGASIKVCGANIENYFSSYGSDSNGAKDEEQFLKQTQKIASALLNIDADIYALCEIECGTTASAILVAKMNELAGSNRYDYVDNGLEAAANQAMVGYLYRKDKVAPTEKTPYFPYSSEYLTWYRRLIMREFKELSSNETFVISINHFKAKVSAWETQQASNTQNLLNGLDDIKNNSKFANNRVLILGDFNSYTHEKTIQNVIAAGYKDILPHDNPLEDYSYVYHGETGYLDRAFASEDLLEYIVDVRPYHVNADYHYRHEYKYEPSTLYRYSDHDPILVGINFSGITTTTDNIQTASQAVKVIIDGTLYIINNGVRYTVTGLVVE